MILSSQEEQAVLPLAVNRLCVVRPVFPRTPPSIQLRCHTVRHSLQTEKMKLAIEAQSTCFLHASDVVRNFSQSVGGKKIQCYIKPWDTISSIEITKELMIVSAYTCHLKFSHCCSAAIYNRGFQSGWRGTLGCRDGSPGVPRDHLIIFGIYLDTKIYI